MTTPVRNKAIEVKTWIDTFTPPEPSPELVKQYIERRWPDLLAKIQHDIFILALGETF
jgi:hypothetical protein